MARPLRIEYPGAHAHKRVTRTQKGQVSTLDTFNFFDMFWQIPKQSRRQRWHGR